MAALQRRIGTVGLLLFAVGGIVGSGWLFGPYYAARTAGPASVLAWLLGGGLMMFIALTFAELAAMFPVAGGSIRFLQMSHGTFVSFTFAWIAWLSSVSVAPIETMALLQYSSQYAPGLMRVVSGVHVLTTMGIVVAALLMAVMVWVNSVGVQLLSKSNTVIVCFKLLIPFLTAFILFATDFHFENFTAKQFEPMGLHGLLAALPAAGIIFSFIGYSPAIQLAGEAKNPQRAIPFAIIGALVLCMVLYVLLQAAFIGAVPSSAYQNGWAALHFKGDAGPFVALMGIVGLAWFVKVLYADAFVSPFGTALIYTGSTARMALAMGENGYMPRFMMQLNAKGVPVRLLLLNYSLGLFLFLPFPSWQTMMSFLVSALVFAYAVGPLALIVLRDKMPEQERPFRLPCAPVMAFIAFYVCNLILLWTGWATISKMLIAIGLGLLVLCMYQFSGSHRLKELHWENAAWVLCYLAMVGVVSFLSSFGGGIDRLPFGCDFAAIFVLSLITFLWAYHQGVQSELGDVS